MLESMHLKYFKQKKKKMKKTKHLIKEDESDEQLSQKQIEISFHIEVDQLLYNPFFVLFSILPSTKNAMFIFSN